MRGVSPTVFLGSHLASRWSNLESFIWYTGPHVNETWCVISRAKCDLAALARGAALVIDLYFFNGVPFSFEARLTGTVCRENINYSTTTPPLVLVV